MTLLAEDWVLLFFIPYALLWFSLGDDNWGEKGYLFSHFNFCQKGIEDQFALLPDKKWWWHPMRCFIFIVSLIGFRITREIQFVFMRILLERFNWGRKILPHSGATWAMVLRLNEKSSWTPALSAVRLQRQCDQSPSVPAATTSSPWGGCALKLCKKHPRHEVVFSRYFATTPRKIRKSKFACATKAKSLY